MGNIRYHQTAPRIPSAVNCRPLKPSPRSICPAAPYPTGVHIPGIPPPAKFATEPVNLSKTLDLPMSRFDLMFDINVRGTFAATKACLPHLKTAQNPHVLTLSPPLD